jgi:hypothetical protein
LRLTQEKLKSTEKTSARLVSIRTKEGEKEKLEKKSGSCLSTTAPQRFGATPTFSFFFLSKFASSSRLAAIATFSTLALRWQGSAAPVRAREQAGRERAFLSNYEFGLSRDRARRRSREEGQHQRKDSCCCCRRCPSSSPLPPSRRSSEAPVARRAREQAHQRVPLGARGGQRAGRPRESSLQEQQQQQRQQQQQQTRRKGA